MRAYSVVLFLVCLNIAVYIMAVSGFWPVSQYPEGYTSPTDIADTFKIENIDLSKIVVLTGGTILAGIIAWFTRQTIPAAAVLAIWVFGVVLTPIGWVVTGFPLMVKSLAEGVGVPTPMAVMFQTALTAFYVLMFFMFLVEIMSQRQIT